MRDKEKSLHTILRNSTTSTKLVTLVVVFMISFSLYVLYCFNTVKEVKVTGPFYARIIQGKDVIADILPPPEYLVEAYLNAFQMLHCKSPGELGELVDKAGKLKSDYLARHAYWASVLPDDALRTGLLRNSYEPAVRMLDAIEKELVPAVRAGDPVAAEKVLSEKVRVEYLSHRKEIDKVVELAARRNREDEARARVAVHSRTFGQVLLGVFLFFFLTIFSAYLVRQIEAGQVALSEDAPTRA